MKRSQAVLGAMVVFCAYLGLAFALASELHESMSRVESEGMSLSKDGYGASTGCMTLYGQALRSTGRTFNASAGDKFLDGSLYDGNVSISCPLASAGDGHSEIQDLSRVFAA